MGDTAAETGRTKAGGGVAVDWMGHVAFVFIVCALLALKWPVFGGRNTVLVMIGALLPDLFKLYLPLRLIGVHAVDVLALFHIPVGTLLVCGLCALLFETGTRERVFLLFAFGMVTHYALDVLLISVTGGLMLAFPLSWETWQLDLVRPNNWLGNTILAAGAVLLWLVLKAWRQSSRPATEKRPGDI
ncbi:MAG: metal-dependent hydrolase [Halobacteriota archaeon]